MRGTAQRSKAQGGRHKGRRAGRKLPHTAVRRRSKHVRRRQTHLETVAPRGTETLPLSASAAPLLKDGDSALQGIALPPLERRLQKRYLIMVRSHLRSAPELAAGVASLPSSSAAFAATQASWRFLNNDRISLSALVEPMRAVGRERLAKTKMPFGLLVHDWSKLSFTYAASKRDLTQLTHTTDVGYELTTALLVSADDGSPLAPMEMHLKTADGVLSTRKRAPKDVPHTDQVLPTMKAARTWNLDKPLVHVIDREADSVDHYRQWDAAGFYFLVRGDDRRVKWNGRSYLLSEIRATLSSSNTLDFVMDVLYFDTTAQLWVSETSVTLHRPAKKSDKGRKYERPGRPLTLRYIVVQLRDVQGHVLAEWMLLSNVPDAWATAEQLAFCYYWRWRIESFFKLLKSHGQQLEQWQQESGRAIARRLLVAAMACVVVWQLQADQSPEAEELKNILIRLSGRQMKRKRPNTAPALLAGIWVLLSMLALLEHYDLNGLRKLAARIPYFVPT
jgi:DDE family transposase